eukprot:s1935_g4.t2
MLPAGEFLNFAIAGRLEGHGWCRRKMQELRADVLAGISDIQQYGIGLPLFHGLTRPTAIAFDPTLQPDAMRRCQRLWQIEGPASCLCCISECHALDPIAVLHYENQKPLDFVMVEDSIAFMEFDCCSVQLVCWESISATALPWPVMQQFPLLPRREGTIVDYAILYLQYKTVGLAMCFWRESLHPGRMTLLSWSTDDDSAAPVRVSVIIAFLDRAEVR